MPAGDRLLDVEAVLAAAFATPLPIVGYSPARERRSRRQRAVGSSLEEMRASFALSCTIVAARDSTSNAVSML